MGWWPATEVYSVGLVHISVCTEEPIEAAIEAANREHPTGLDHGWALSATDFADGSPQGANCPTRAGHLHYLLVC